MSGNGTHKTGRPPAAVAAGRRQILIFLNATLKTLRGGVHILVEDRYSQIIQQFTLTFKVTNQVLKAENIT